MPDDITFPARGEPHSAAAFQRIFAAQKAAYAAEPMPSLEARRARLDALEAALNRFEDDFVRSVADDFGTRAREETIMADILTSLSAIGHAKRNLRRWTAPRRVATPLHMMPAKSRIEPQPLGVVGIISPWNYPVGLALAPAAAALAAGNRVMIKPSEATPRTSAKLQQILSMHFDEASLAVVPGGIETAEAFAALPFDRLFFTGSTEIGRKVAQAAARNLTPVTLELGGKSPAIIDPSADLPAAARAIAHGKTINAGQTCIAPDYALIPHDMLGAATDAIASAARELYPEIDTTPDYASIVSDRHFERLKALVEEARGAGARIVEIGSANALHPARKFPVTLIVDPPEGLRVMKEEIFGPVLVLLGVRSRDEAIARVNAGPRPLALYWFGADKDARRDVLARTVSGGVTVNGTLWHFAQPNLPFGGVGASGMGAYHGDAGFETFSHMKPVFYQSRFSAGGRMAPPFTETTRRMIELARKFL